MEADPDITPTVREAVSWRSITLMSDEELLVHHLRHRPSRKADLMAINSKVRGRL